jgi:hypothetical protein
VMASMERPELVPCPVCHGVPIDHGEHCWRFDEYSLTGPVVWRCEVCNATVQFATRERFRRTPSGTVGMGHNIIRNGLIPHGRVKTSPCDVCGGAGVVPQPDDTGANRIRAIVARRAAKGWVGLIRSPSPRIRRRYLAVLSVCPRCWMSDRVVPVIHTIGVHEDESRLSDLGEALIDDSIGQTAHFCGRCHMEFGSAGEEFVAGLH